jgi:hypothetical protein
VSHTESERHIWNFYKDRKGKSRCSHKRKIGHGIFCNFVYCTKCGYTEGYREAFIEKAFKRLKQKGV